MLKIFIVDDEQIIIDVLRIYLEQAGYKIYSATTGIEALQVINKIKPDCIILDLMLPDISGGEMCKIIRKESDALIMMLIAKTAEGGSKEIFTGADYYIMKPFSPSEVTVRIQGIIRRWQELKSFPKTEET